MAVNKVAPPAHRGRGHAPDNHIKVVKYKDGMGHVRETQPEFFDDRKQWVKNLAKVNPQAPPDHLSVKNVIRGRRLLDAVDPYAPGAGEGIQVTTAELERIAAERWQAKVRERPLLSHPRHAWGGCVRLDARPPSARSSVLALRGKARRRLRQRYGRLSLVAELTATTAAGVFGQLKIQAEQEANVTIIEKWSEENDYREYFIVRHSALASALPAIATTAAFSDALIPLNSVRVLLLDDRPGGGPRAKSDALRMPLSDGEAWARAAAQAVKIIEDVCVNNTLYDRGPLILRDEMPEVRHRTSCTLWSPAQPWLVPG